MKSFSEDPKRHANLGVLVAGLLIGMAVGWELWQGGQNRSVSVLLFLASYPVAAYGCAGYAASKGYSVWWGILPALLGLNLLALSHLTNLQEQKSVGTEPRGINRLADGLLLIVTAVMVFGLLASAVLAWGGNIEPKYRRLGKIGVAIGLVYFAWLFILGRSLSASKPSDSGPDWLRDH